MTGQVGPGYRDPWDPPDEFPADPPAPAEYAEAVLPPGVSFTWERRSRRTGELKVFDGGRTIFYALTDGRRWDAAAVVALLEARS